MIALKKITTFGFFIFGMSLSSLAQEKGDLGILFSTNKDARIALEYRIPVKEKFKFKIGGEIVRERSYPNYYSRIIDATDSAIVKRNFSTHKTGFGLRIGGERVLGNSMFSVGGDLNLNYRKNRKSNFNSLEFLPGFTNEFNTIDYNSYQTESSTRYTMHYFVPTLRLSLNLDVPVGKAFLFNAGLNANMGLPIYMGATDIVDPAGEFMGSPYAVFDVLMNANIGLRYIIGAPIRKRA